ncbi:MAG: DUF1146 domain-containing protein [Bacilli bacterium]|nr:DUF1146 domain-containing protein [Bacilli bacterium]
MNVKSIIYILITPFVIYCMDSLNLNHVFKKNKIAQARILYLLVGLALSYLVVNFIYDFYEVSQII